MWRLSHQGKVEGIRKIGTETWEVQHFRARGGSGANRGGRAVRGRPEEGEGNHAESQGMGGRRGQTLQEAQHASGGLRRSSLMPLVGEDRQSYISHGFLARSVAGDHKECGCPHQPWTRTVPLWKVIRFRDIS